MGYEAKPGAKLTKKPSKIRSLQRFPNISAPEK
jgi:hypothetical protein